MSLATRERIVNHMTSTPETTTLRSDTDRRAELVDRAATVGALIDSHAERHDREGSFVVEAVDLLRESGLLRAAVPIGLGGEGATVADIVSIQRELGRHCGSTALASAMHQHVVAFTAWRYRRALPGAEATLRRVADDGIVLLSTGGADLTHPRGKAHRVDGGYEVTGRKHFVSQAPVGAVLSTMFAFDDPDRGLRVLNMGVPVGADGVSVVDDWDALGMRGTGSGQVSFDRVFVPDDRILADRPHGVIDPPLQAILTIALPIIAGAYLGIADSAYAAAVAGAASRAEDAGVQRQLGLMSSRRREAAWALEGVLVEIGDDPAPSVDLLDSVLAAKRAVVLAAVEICDLAMEVAGGSAYRKGSVIERSVRDVRAGMFHPLTPERSLVHAGRLALGMPTDGSGAV